HDRGRHRGHQLAQGHPKTRAEDGRRTARYYPAPSSLTGKPAHTTDPARRVAGVPGGFRRRASRGISGCPHRAVPPASASYATAPSARQVLEATPGDPPGLHATVSEPFGHLSGGGLETRAKPP